MPQFHGIECEGPARRKSQALFLAIVQLLACSCTATAAVNNDASAGQGAGGVAASSGVAGAFNNGGSLTGGSPAVSGASGTAGTLGRGGTGSSSGGLGNAGSSSGSGGSAGATSAGTSSGESGSPAGGGSVAVQDPGTTGDGDFTISSPFAAQAEVSGTGAPHGKSYGFTMRSQDSKIYNGSDSTLLAQNQHSFTRDVSVYVPKQYLNGTEVPFMVVLDGGAYTGGQNETITLIDNLMNSATPADRIPTMILIFVANGGGDSLGSERGLEYDTMSGRFGRFIDTEVLPAAVKDNALKKDYPNLNLTSNPEGRGVLGCSSGGSAAFAMAWFTDNYRRIISYSGTFVDQQDTDAAVEKTYPDGAWDFQEMLIPNSDRKPIRVFLEVGSKDNDYTKDAASKHNWVIANQRMAAALKAKGYHYRFVYANGAGHGDNGARKATVADAFRWMWRGYPLH